MSYLARVGIGYDFHRVVNQVGASIPICGVQFECDLKVQAHSDGDVALHAVTDAILGAMAQGNIGTHFPNTDERWRNCESKVFVQCANKLVLDAGGKLINIDMTIVCERPKIMPRSFEMRKCLAKILDMDIQNISVKAVTTEGMGSIGRGEGIAVQAICSIMMPYRT